MGVGRVDPDVDVLLLGRVVAAEAAAGDRVEIETIYCLGLCSVGPNAMVGKKLHARLDSSKLTQIIREMA